MRIRKHAKISPLIYATSSLEPGPLPQPHICQLNQSPWDVMNFSPPPPPSTPPSLGFLQLTFRVLLKHSITRFNSLYVMFTIRIPFWVLSILRFYSIDASIFSTPQVNGNYGFAGSGSSRDSIAVIEGDRKRMIELNKATKWEHSASISGGASSNETAEQEAGTSPKDDPIILFCKSWQCRKEAAKGNSLCEHHLIMEQSYSINNSAHSATKNSAKPSAEARGRPRIKKRAAQSLSNPYVFYYYSGFGPRWGKKRGEVSKNTNEELYMPKHDLEDDKEASSLCDIEDAEIEGLDGDEEEKKEEIGKKRGRKPIKARSLKSLM